MGSSKEVKKAPVDIIERVTETLETLIAPKKVSQCTAIMKPAKQNPAMTFLGKRNDFLVSTRKTNTMAVANNILYQTKGIASNVINAPNTAVNPQMKTIKCRCR